MTPAPISFRGPVLLGLFALVILVAGFGSWALLARLESAIILQGQIAVEGSRQVVQHPDGGVVVEVFVREGSRVAAGDPLLRLEAPDLVLELLGIEARLSTLSVRAARLTAERDGAEALVVGAATPAPSSPQSRAEVAGQTRLFTLRLELFRNAAALLSLRATQLGVQAQGIAAQSDAVAAQLALAEEELADHAALFGDGLVPQTSVLALGREAARLRGGIAELAVALAQTEGQITETDLRIGNLATERVEAAVAELREIEPILLDLAEARRALLARIDRLVIRAPISGIVLGLQVPKPQVVLQAAAPVLSLVPIDRPLLVTARIRPEDIDAVFLGQSAEFAISAFATSTAPRLRGTVTLIAADTLVEPETGALFYTVELALDPAHQLHERQTLLPGMRVEAFLATGARSPIAYLLDPFTAFFDHALREG